MNTSVLQLASKIYSFGSNERDSIIPKLSFYEALAEDAANKLSTLDLRNPKDCVFDNYTIFTFSAQQSLFENLTSYLNFPLDNHNFEEHSSAKRCVDILEVLIIMHQHGLLHLFENIPESKSTQCRFYQELVSAFGWNRHFLLPISLGEVLSILHFFHSSVLPMDFHQSLVDDFKNCLQSLSVPTEEPMHLSLWIASLAYMENLPTCLRFCSKVSCITSQSVQQIFHALVQQLNDTERRIVVQITSKSTPIFELVDLVTMCQLLVLWSDISRKLQHSTLKCTRIQAHAMADRKDEGLVEKSTYTEASNDSMSDLQPTPPSDKDDEDDSADDSSRDNLPSVWSISATTNEMASTRLKSALKNHGESSVTEDLCDRPVMSSAMELNLLRRFSNSHDFARLIHPAVTQAILRVISAVRVGTNSVRIGQPNDTQDVVTTPLSFGPSACWFGLLLHTPAYPTSIYGPLFSSPGISIVDVSTEEFPLKWEQQFHPNSTAQSTMNSWLGVVGTGVGLPYPSLFASESVANFVALVVHILIPGLLSMMESDLQTAGVYRSSVNVHSTSDCPPHGGTGTTDNSETGIEPQDKTKCDLNKKNCDEQTMHSDGFWPLVLSVLKMLLQFLSGDPVESSSPNEVCGITVQLGEVFLSAVNEDYSTGIERVALCVSDCVLLHSLCHTMANVFQNEFQIAMALISGGPVDFPTSGFLSNRLSELVKQYNSSIRLVGEHLVDMCLMENEQVIATNLGVDFSVNDSSMSGDVSSLSCTVHQHLQQTWYTISRTCPAGLARQIMAHVSAHCLTSCTLLFTSNDYVTCLDRSHLECELRKLLKTAEFCLFRCAETTADVVGFGQLSSDVSLLHSAANTLTQVLVCHCMPDALWNKTHGDGFYHNILSNEAESFELSVSNWLRFSNPSLFPKPPFILMRDHQEQTELEINWELFLLSRHFDPVRILSLVVPYGGGVCVNLLCSNKLSDPDNSLPEIAVAIQVFQALFQIFAHIPGLELFHATVLTQLLSRSHRWTLQADSADPSTPDRWPPWFRAMISLLDEPVSNLWESFRCLVQRHVDTDESLSISSLMNMRDRSPQAILTSHQPRQRSFWKVLFPQGNLPCGCDLPRPAWISSSLVDFDQKLPMHAESSPLSKHPQSMRNEWKEEIAGSRYLSFYTDAGQVLFGWRKLACDLIRSIAVALPTGLQLALNNVCLDSDTENNLRGGHLAIHLILAGILSRIYEEPTNPEDAPSNVLHAKRLQLLVLWEHLCTMLESSEEKEIFECKRRMLFHLDELNSSVCDSSDLTTHSVSARRLKLSHYVYLVQQKALPHMFFLHKFFKHNCTWMRNAIRQRREHSTLDEQNENIELKLFIPNDETDDRIPGDDSDTSQLPFVVPLDWENLRLINIGLTIQTIHELRTTSSLHHPLIDLPSTGN